jgi:hypothetical protein
MCAGGACGYGSLVDVKPFRARVGAVSPVLFKNGEGCGACYKVRCLDKSICSRRAVTIIVTDECPGGYCSNGNTHFDLSGAAFGRMAISGENGQLRNRGEIPVIYRRYGPGLCFICVYCLWLVIFFSLSSLTACVCHVYFVTSLNNFGFSL